MLQPSKKERRTVFARRSAFMMAQFLLGFGADPNEMATPDGSLNSTVWQQFFKEYYKNTDTDDDRYLWRKARAMLRYGADQNAEVETGGTLTLSARICLLSHASETEVTLLLRELSDAAVAETTGTEPIRRVSRVLSMKVPPEVKQLPGPNREPGYMQFVMMLGWTVATIVCTILFMELSGKVRG